MKKQALLAAVLLATGVTFAQAGETLGADSSAQVFINGFSGKTQPHVGPAGNEKPSVAKSLAIGAASILGTGARLPESVSTGTPDVSKSLARYTSQYQS
jgi:uncharacterized protein YdeI (BOF family)